MRMPNLLKKSKKIKKSQALLIGSLLVFGGSIFLSWNYLLKMRDEVFSDMKIAMMDVVSTDDGEPAPNHVPASVAPQNQEEYVEDYSKYFGVLEIPRIGLKRGFYNIGSKYNDIQYNVTLEGGSILPYEGYGNMLLTAHSGDSYISYFAYLYRLNVGDECFITLNGVSYHYRIVDIHTINKSGLMIINFNTPVRTLTLVTCTKDNDTLQTVYVAEFVG